MRWWLIFWVSILMISSVHADVPTELHYNGFLTNAVGEPVDCPNALECGEVFDLTFRLYHQVDGGALLWEEVHPEVPLYQGSFHVTLGAIAPITADFLSEETWLAVKVNDSPEMDPRQRLSSSAYALRAQVAESADEAGNAAQLGGMAPSSFATSESVNQLQTGLAPVATTGSYTDLLDVPADQDTLSDLVCAPEQVARWNGSAWVCSDSANTGVSLESTPCDEDHAGEFHLDTSTNKLRICTGEIWLNVRVCDDNCPLSNTVVCGGAIDTDCGTLCPGAGTALNPAQCLISQSTTLCGTPVLDSCGNACGTNGTALDLSSCLPNATQCGQLVNDACGNSCGQVGSFCAPGQNCLSNSCCGNNVVEGSEQCDDGNLIDGDDCSSECKNNSIDFVGYATWNQTCSSQSDAQQDALMDAACQSNYGPSARAAFHSELVEGLISGLPGSNGSGEHLLLKCPNCVGDSASFCVSGHSRKCVNPGHSWPSSYTTPDWNGNCNNSNRSALCVN